MPTYDYQCGACYHRFEAFQSMTDKPLTECPSCGGKVKRLISAGAGLIFKGSGFYITDYKNKEQRTTPGVNKGSGVKNGSAGKSAGPGQKKESIKSESNNTNNKSDKK